MHLGPGGFLKTKEYLMEGAGRSTYTHVKRPGQIFMSFLGPILPHLFGVSNFSNAFVPVHTITSPLQKMYVVSVKKKKKKNRSGNRNRSGDGERDGADP